MLKAATSDRKRILAATENGSGGIQQLVLQFRMENKMPREIQSDSSNVRMLEKLRLRIGDAEDDYRVRKARFGDGHPTVQIAKDQLDRLKASLDEARPAGPTLTDAKALDSYKKLVCLLYTSPSPRDRG